MQTEKEPNNPKNNSLWLKLGGFVLFIIIMLLLVKYTSLGSLLSVEGMQIAVAKAGVWGVLIFIAIFVTAAVMNIPGTGFLLVGILIFGYWQGAIYTYIAALIGSVLTFMIGRKLGGAAFSEVKNPKIQSVLLEAELRPIRTLIILRILMQFSPLVGYTLALTNINARSYIIGNIISIWIPTVAISLLMYFFEDTARAFFG